MGEKVHFVDEDIDLEGYVEGEGAEEINPMLTTLRIIGDKWNILILSYLLNEGDKSFTDILEKFPDLTEAVLTAKIERLESGGTLTQKQTEDGTVYSLTEPGSKLQPLLSEMKDWGKKAAVKAGKGTSVRMGSGKATKDTRGKIKVR